MTEKQIDIININSFSFNSISSVLVAQLKIRCSEHNVDIQYKIDAGIYGNILSYHIFKVVFPWATEEPLVETNSSKNNNSTIRHL